MKKHFATILTVFFLIYQSLTAFNYELNLSYDHFRGLPDGSWNGNDGLVLAANFGTCVYQDVDFQLGGSYGLYNWDGRQNLVFNNPKNMLQQGFLTTGLFATCGRFTSGAVYDRQFMEHFGIYDISASIDQIRFHGGYQFYCEEIGIWGTARLSTSDNDALGVPIKFRAINQINLFWKHYFSNCASAMVWMGAPYGNSLMFDNGTAGGFISGFALRAPLAKHLFLDAHGMYMFSKGPTAIRQARNNDANICVGITYFFGGNCCSCQAANMPIANNSNFLVDTNINQ